MHSFASPAMLVKWRTIYLPVKCHQNNSSSFLFMFRSTLPKDVQQYYCKETQLLEFPIFIHQCILHSCKPDYLKVFAFALITNYALELEPSHISFGTLSTLETIKKEIYLTNHSIAIQEYGFLNLPKVIILNLKFCFRS